MIKNITLYCEGTNNSHDKRILEKLIEELPPQISIVPIGSKKGSGAIISYTEKKKLVQANFYILFRDRDFDKEVPSINLEKEEKKDTSGNLIGYTCYSYLNTIENYLFDTAIFYDFLKKKDLSQKYQINSETEVRNKFIEAAKKIKIYQAVRHTMGKMRKPTDFGTRWTQKSGKLPEKLDEEFCKKQALKKIKKAKRLTNSWNEEHFNKIYQSFIDKFDDKFMNNLDFLVYFQGKDFARSLSILLPEFPLKGYYEYAEKHFDYTKFPDLVELRDLIEKELTI